MTLTEKIISIFYQSVKFFFQIFSKRGAFFSSPLFFHRKNGVVFYLAGFTIRLINLFLTRIVLMTVIPSVAFFTFSISMAAACTVS